MHLGQAVLHQRRQLLEVVVAIADERGVVVLPHGSVAVEEIHPVDGAQQQLLGPLVPGHLASGRGHKFVALVVADVRIVGALLDRGMKYSQLIAG